MENTATAEKTGQQPADAAVAGSGRVLLNESVEIFPSRPVDNPSSPGTQTFAARDRRQTGDQVAILCGRASIPRITNIGSYKNLKNMAILRLFDAGIVNWEPEGRQRYAFIFEKPPAKRLMDTIDGQPYRFSEDRVVPLLIEPILSALAALHNIDIVHGAVNPLNIFISGAEGAETILLGECLTSAPSWRQHAMFEPIERAMAQSTGRGTGTVKEDLYALGMCVALTARGSNFFKGKTEEQIVHEKLEMGSYALAVGGTRMPGSLAEFLRGVLNDDDTQRWGIDEVRKWLEGRRISGGQSRSHLTAARPFIFKNKKYRDLRSLSYFFSKNPVEAAQVIEQDQFDLWIKRNFEDPNLIKNLEGVWERERAAGKDKLVASACMVLDPYAPVRYKNLSIFPSGFGNALADTMAKGGDLQVYGEMLMGQIVSNWINLRFDEILDASGLLSQYEKCRNYVIQKMLGYGLERVLYTLSKECVCMSPLLENYFVMEPGSLLLALENMARQGKQPERILDRHMIAFISVREPKMVDPWLGHIVSQDKANQVVGYIRTLSAIQQRYSTGPVPAVTSWMGSLCGVVVERFNNRDLRKEIARRLGEVQGSGNLMHLLELLDDPRVLQEDTVNFARAQREYAALMAEKQRIEQYLKKRRFFGYATGRQVAMLVSSLFATLCIAGYIAFLFMKEVF